MEFELEKSEFTGIIPQLQYKISNIPNYVTDRKSATFYPSGGSIYGPKKTKTLKFHLSGDQSWLDCSTVQLKFKFNNTSAAADSIKFLNPLPANMFYRMRIIAHNQVVEDWNYYNRVYNMIHCLLPMERKLNDYAMGFGLKDDLSAAGKYDRPNVEIGSMAPPDLSGGSSRWVMMNLMSGLMGQHKYLPLHLINGIDIELELVGDFMDAITETAAGAQRTWEITEPTLICDIVHVDQTIENDISEALLGNASLPIAFDSFVTQLQTVPDADQATISLSRSFTRLKSIFLTFYNEPKELERNGAGDANAGKFKYSTNKQYNLPLSTPNLFYHPNFITPGEALDSVVKPVGIGGANNLSEEGYYRYNEVNDRLSLQVAVGAKNIPEQPIECASQAYYHLRKTLGVHKPDTPFSVNISDREYRSRSFIAGFDLEKVGGAQFTGLNTKMSDQITIKLKNLYHTRVTSEANTKLPGSVAQSMYVTLNYSGLLLISDKGVTILE